jgi:hypothetical protein
MVAMQNDVKIKDFSVAVGFRFDCGYEFLWDCYGSEACGIGWTKDDLSASAGIVYDGKTHVVYEMDVWDTANDVVLRWTRRGFGARRDRESRQRGHDPRIAMDKTRFRDASPAECLNLLRTLVRRKSRQEQRRGCPRG